MSLSSFQTVTDLVGQIKNTLEGNFTQVKVEGEVSNISLSGAGHYYFTLKDSSSSLSCALFRGDAMRNPAIKKLKNGDKIQCMGAISVYQQRGTFQVIARWLKPVGKGDLKEQFEKLKKKLGQEGLFDLEKKKKIPLLGQRIAVITAEGAAALQDFLKVYERRSIWMDIKVFPSLVQGDAAPGQLVKALEKAQKYSLKNPLDVIVITRGGGSLEDLWAFNDEQLARKIADCEIPVISAIGHEVDYALTDFVADYRAETPTAAAEYLTTEQFQLSEKMSHLKKELLNQSYKLSSETNLKLRDYHPRRLVNLIEKKITEQASLLEKYNLWARKEKYLALGEQYMKLDDYMGRLQQNISFALTAEKNKLGHLDKMLASLGPKSVLKRGYSYLSTKENKIISSKKQAKKQKHKDPLQVHFHDGVIEVELKKEM